MSEETDLDKVRNLFTKLEEQYEKLLTSSELIKNSDPEVYLEYMTKMSGLVGAARDVVEKMTKREELDRVLKTVKDILKDHGND